MDHTNIFQYGNYDIDKLRAGLSHSEGSSVLTIINTTVAGLLLKDAPVKRLLTLVGEYAPPEAQAEFMHRLKVVGKGLTE